MLPSLLAAIAVQKFMIEILFDVPPEPKFWLRPCLAPQILGSRKPHGARAPMHGTRLAVIYLALGNMHCLPIFT